MVISILEITTQHGAIEGKTQVYVTIFYNLGAIISVGYSINSKKATQLRIWATKVLKEYMQKGFVLDDERLKQGRAAFGKDYYGGDRMRLKSGCKVPFPDLLEEGYMVKGNQIIANIDIKNIEAVMQHFIMMHEEPLFFILELPAAANDESEIRPGVVKELHKDVYYIDGCTQEEALAILLKAGNILFNDGLSAFGYGGHESDDEIMFGKYNVLTIFSKDIEKYDEFFGAHKVKKKSNILTAWEIFDKDHPGISERVTIEGKDVFSLPKQFEEWGMYFAERREE